MTRTDKIEWAKTEHIIFAAMVTGLGKGWDITEKDVAVIYRRMSAYEHLIDSPVAFREEDGTLTKHWLTLADFRKRIGLCVNVSPVSESAFERRLGQIALRQVQME